VDTTFVTGTGVIGAEVLNNPFHFSLPTRPDEFAGRHSLLDEMTEDLCSLSGRNSYGIVAGRRAGKSSLLLALEHNLHRTITGENSSLRVLPVFFSLKNLQFEKSADIFGFALHRLRIATSGVRKGPPFSTQPHVLDLQDYIQPDAMVATLQDLEVNIEQIIANAYTKLGLIRIVFLMDEMDEVLDFPWTSRFFGNLRSLIYDGPVKEFVRLVVAGSGRYTEAHEKGSQFFNAVKSLFLEAFDDDGIRELLNRAGKIQPEVAAEVIKQAGGHPFILQHILYYLFNRGIESLAVEDVVAEVRRFSFDRSEDLDHWWNAIGEDGQQVYCTLRESNEWRSISDLTRSSDNFQVRIDRGIKALCYHGLVVHDGSYQTYGLKGHLFRQWSTSRFQAISSTLIGRTFSDNNTKRDERFGSNAKPKSKRKKQSTSVNERSKVFISYSHKDKRLFEEFKTMLAPAIRKGIVDLWDDQRIAPGTQWRNEIQTALDSAKVAVLLVSQHFLASDFIAKHELPPLMKAAQDNGVLVFWVYLSSCLYEETEIAEYQAAHDISKPLDRLDKPERQAVLSKVCKTLVRLAQKSHSL
jgi:hypothetical protein